MKTHILKISDPQHDERAVTQAGSLIAQGKIVAIPTETVYGLATNALNGEAVGRIFIAKGRPQDNPLIVHIAEPAQIDTLSPAVPESARLLAKAFWPGPLTMVVKKNETIPNETTAGLDTVAVRCPSHPVARAIIKAAGVPVAAPSANLSGKPSTTDVGHVIKDMYGRIDAIVDGGPSSIGLESTVIDLTSSPPRLLRPGGITLEQLRQVLGEVAVDSAVSSEPDLSAPVRSPGMKYRHYAPEAQVLIVRGSSLRAADYINNRAHTGEKRAAVLCFDEEVSLYPGLECVSYGPEKDYDALARNLFSALRQLDSGDIGIIFARCPEGGGLSLAVENRLKKAAGFQIITV